MSKRNKILISVLVAAVLTLLIALCFVGNTFARYTLEKETVTADIAEWGVSIDDSGLQDDEGKTKHSVTVEGLNPAPVNSCMPSKRTPTVM